MRKWISVALLFWASPVMAYDQHATEDMNAAFLCATYALWMSSDFDANKKEYIRIRDFGITRGELSYLSASISDEPIGLSKEAKMFFFIGNVFSASTEKARSIIYAKDSDTDSIIKRALQRYREDACGVLGR